VNTFEEWSRKVVDVGYGADRLADYYSRITGRVRYHLPGSTCDMLARVESLSWQSREDCESMLILVKLLYDYVIELDKRVDNWSVRVTLAGYLSVLKQSDAVFRLLSGGDHE